MSHAGFLTFLAMRGLVRFVLNLIASTSLLTGLVLIVLSVSNGGIGRGLLGVGLIITWWVALYVRMAYDLGILRRTPPDCTFHLTL